MQTGKVAACENFFFHFVLHYSVACAFSDLSFTSFISYRRRFGAKKEKKAKNK